MSEEFQAVYDDGVLRLDKPLNLPDQTPVRGVIVGPSHPAQPASSASPDELAVQQQALDAMRKRIAKIPQEAARDGLSGRDHDAILYGERE